MRLVLALLLACGCGGSEPPREEAPLPDAWVREDRGQDRPEPIAIGERARPIAGGETPEAPAEAARDEQASRTELQGAMREAWNREPGHPRAQSVCMARVRVATFARRWIEAYGRAYPNVQQDPSEVSEVLSEIERWCASDETLDHPELVEGAFQGLAAEIDERPVP